MPDKDGDDDEKSTKSVVNKKQKQMMNKEDYLPEEGYDIARDMGKVSPSKDKKDATSLPVSDKVKKTQKVNKGPSAFEIVKAKYGKSVMNGKKKANEELDLTQVAESFGGYIVEIKIERDKSGTVIGVETTPAERAAAKKAQEKQREIFKKAAAKRDQKDKLKGAEDQIKNIKTGTRPVDKETQKDILKDVDAEQLLDRPRADKSEKSRKSYDRIMSDSRREAAKDRRAEKLKDPKFRASETLRKAKQTDIKGGPSVKRGDPISQEVKKRKIKNAAADIDSDAPYQRNTFKPQTGQQTFDKMFGPDSKVRRIQTGEKPEIADPFGDKTKPKPRKSRTIPFKDRKQLDPETQKKVDAVTPAFATRTGASGKPIPVSMRNVRVPSERSIEKLKPSQKGNIIVMPGKTKPQDPGINPEVTDDNPNQRRAGVGNRTLPGTPPKTGPGFGKRFGQFMDFTRKNPVVSLIGYDILRKTGGKVKDSLKVDGVKGGKAIQVRAGK